MKLEEVLGYIPKEELEQLSINYKVDHPALRSVLLKNKFVVCAVRMSLTSPRSLAYVDNDSAELHSVPTKLSK